MSDATRNETSPKITIKPDQSSIVGSDSSENIGSTNNTAATSNISNINNNVTTADNNNDEDDDGDDMLLVTEFPPPPYYYTLASTHKLTPPEIPHRAFRVAAKRVRQEKERARLESEKIRLEAEKNEEGGRGSSSSSASVGVEY